MNKLAQTNRVGTVIVIAIAVLAGVGSALANPTGVVGTLGATVNVHGNEVQAAIPWGNYGSYVCDIYVVSPVSIYIGTNREPQNKFVSLGRIAAGQEIIVAIKPRGTGYTFYTGSASRNADGIAHAYVNGWDTFARVTFEDQWGGGYGTYLDAIVEISAINRDPVAEAGPDQTLTATSADGAPVTLDGSKSSDAESEALTYYWYEDFRSIGINKPNAYLGSGATLKSSLPVGKHRILLAVRDASMSPGTYVYDFLYVTVNPGDTLPPTLQLPADMTVEQQNEQGAKVSYAVTATDDQDPSPTVASAPASGSVFAPGVTTVQCMAIDASGKKTTGSFKVTVQDTIAPKLQVPTDLTVEATSPSGAAVTFSTAAVDACDPAPKLTSTPASGSTFPLGTTTVACTATDKSGNTATGSFKVTVQDTTAPKLQVPSDITVEATGPSGAVVTFAPTATDAGDAAPRVLCTPAAGRTFPIGTTLVTCTAVDKSGNVATGSFKVTVQDTTAPKLAVPGDMTVEAKGPSGAPVTFTVTATDACDPAPKIECSPAASSTFPIGTTAVTVTATDKFGNAATGSFSVTVQDTTAPKLAVPGDMLVEATGPSGATVTFTVTATDACDPAPKVECSPAASSTFPIGTTTVTCTATDKFGNTATSSFNVVVQDTAAPELHLPSDITVAAQGPTGAVVKFSVTVTDADDRSPRVVCNPASGSMFPIGTTTVACTAVDKAGNVASGAFRVTVQDAAAPDLAVPGDMTVRATSAAGALVTFTATATDAVDGACPVTCTPASGSVFRLGTTTVTCTASDKSGNKATASFRVTVTGSAAVVPAIIEGAGFVYPTGGQQCQIKLRFDSGLVAGYFSVVEPATGKQITAASANQIFVSADRDEATITGMSSAGAYTLWVKASTNSFLLRVGGYVLGPLPVQGGKIAIH